MKPSPYDKHGYQHEQLTFEEVEPRIHAALQIYQINGTVSGVQQNWRHVHTFGEPWLQQKVWRMYATNGLFIGRLASGEICVEKPPNDKMQKELMGWFVNGNILAARHDGADFEAYIDYALTEDGIILLPYDLQTRKAMPQCLILDVSREKFVRPVGDFELPREI